MFELRGVADVDVGMVEAVLEDARSNIEAIGCCSRCVCGRLYQGLSGYRLYAYSELSFPLRLPEG